MQAKRLTLAAGVETAFEFDSFFTRSVIVKNMTGGAIQFCDGPFDAAKSAIIPAFGWQTFTVTVPYGEKPKFHVKASVAGDVEINFGSEMAGNVSGTAKLTGSSIPDLESVPIHAVEAIETVGYFNSPVIMPDVSTELAGSTTGSPSISVDISNAKNIGVFADLKTAVADEDLVFEVSHDNSTWFAFETKNFATPSSRYNYFALASGGNILANYIRVTPKNNDGSAITLPYIILVIKG